MMFKGYLLTAGRVLGRNKVNTLINTLGLALGIAACIVIYLITSFELSFDTFHRDKDRIYRLGARVEENTGAATTYEQYAEDVPPPVPSALRQEIPGLESVAGFYSYRASVTIGAGVPNSRNNAIIAGPEYFSIFQYDWLAGNAKSSLSNPFSVVLTQSQATNYFGHLPPDKVIGKEIRYDDSLRVYVTGIVKDWRQNTDFPYTEFISFGTIGSSFLRDQFQENNWHFVPGKPWATTFVKLAPNQQPAPLNTLLKEFVTRHVGTDSFLRLIHFGLVLQPMSDIHFNEAYSHDGRRKAHMPTLYGLTGIAFFILLIAIINFINLSTAQAMQRGKEIAIHKVLGSGRWNLIARFLVETAVITLLATILGMLLENPILSLFHSYIPEGVEFHFFQPSVWIFILVVTSITSLLAGLYPAFLLSSYHPVAALKGLASPKESGKAILRKSLIVFQFTISLFFIIGSIAINRQIHYVLNAALGFSPNAVLSIYTMGHATEEMKVFTEKIRRLPRVQSISNQWNPPISAAIMEFPVRCQGGNNKELMVALQAADEFYIPLYQMKLLAGRNLSPGVGLKEYVINGTYCRMLGFSHPEEALGKFLTWQGQTCPIIGVVADFHDGSFHEPIRPIFIGHVPRLEDKLGVKLVAGSQHMASYKTTLSQMEQAWKETFPGTSFNYYFLDEGIARLYEKDRQTAWLVHAATIVTIFISCMGLLGLILFMIEKKKKEISIRKVLGAGISDVIGLLNKEFVLLISLSLLIASPIAWYCLNRWLEDFTYRISLSWWIFVLAGISAITIACGTISFQVIRAALANPVRYLRSE